MRGKYSPTVTAAYMKDQEWFRKLLATQGAYEADGTRSEYGSYDVDGFDSYGYNKDDVDRAGNKEHDYYMGYEDNDGNYHDVNWAYDNALDAYEPLISCMLCWSFDGVKPVCRKS